METCGFCGFENSDKMHFCRKCGNPLSKKKNSREKKARISKDKDSKDKEKKTSWKSLGLIAVFCVVLGGVLLLASNQSGIAIEKLNKKDGLALKNDSSAKKAESDQDKTDKDDEEENNSNSIAEATERADNAEKLQMIISSDELATIMEQSESKYEDEQIAGIFEFLLLDIKTVNDQSYIYGALKNKSKIDFKPFKMVFAFYDKDNLFVDSAIVENPNFYAYNVMQFDVPIPSETAVKYKILVFELNDTKTEVNFVLK